MKKPVLALTTLLAALLLLISLGWWRGSSAGAQVQVPMFYDAHYLFPRPWTQEQAAPGIPAPASASVLYGPNQVSQAFIPGAARLAMIELWLAGPGGEPVVISLTAPDGTTYSTELMLDAPEGRYYSLSFPAQLDSAGERYVVTLSAPEATMSRPVTVHTVGGDSLGAAVEINEYSRPGNLDLRTYSQGSAPGGWWLSALGEQFLPALFRLRLQQYKPAPFKGELFAGLLLVMVGMTAVYLVLARPDAQRLATASAWAIVLVLGAFLAWEVATGQVKLPLLTRPAELQAGAQMVSEGGNGGSERLVNDLLSTLWTAQRLPEERFFSLESVMDEAAGASIGAVRAPGNSAIRYPMVVPPAASVVAGAEVEGEGEGEVSLRIVIEDDGEKHEVAVQRLQEGDQPAWFNVSLAEWAGRDVFLTLEAEALQGESEVRWLRPQIVADHAAWLLDDLPVAAKPQPYRFGEQVQLLGYEITPADPAPGQPATVTLYWQVGATVDANAKVFVHILSATGDILAQHDAFPVQNTYPISSWQPGVIVADAHQLVWPDGADVGAIAVGLYDPDTLERWPAWIAGDRQPDDRIVIPLTPQEAP